MHSKLGTFVHLNKAQFTINKRLSQYTKKRFWMQWPSYNVKKILTCPNHDASVAKELEFTRPGHSDAYFFAHYIDMTLSHPVVVLVLRPTNYSLV